MRLVATNRLTPDMVLARDVVTGVHGRIPLLRAGAKLRDEYRAALLGAGIHGVYVEDELGAGIQVSPALTDETREKATKALVRSFADVPTLAARGDTLSEKAVDELASVAELICRDLANADDAVLALSDLAAADQYTLQHSIDVTALGILIARTHFQRHGHPAPLGKRRRDQMDRQLTKLGVGLLLHDIGKLAIPLGILNKPGKLTPEEWEIMKTHPRAGVDILDGSRWSPLVKAVVLRHHERWNGSGYPDGKAGNEIHQMARIAAVADVYDAITSERLYAPARPAHVGVRAIIEGKGSLFEPEVVDAFCRVVAPFPAGTEVELVDGRAGIVASVPDEALDRPVVRLLGPDGIPQDEVSLLHDQSLAIKDWEHQPNTGPASSGAYIAPGTPPVSVNGTSVNGTPVGGAAVNGTAATTRV
jgi:HD-GYP domain-containing protein (c-di-GMP phosphodiesterase class II)